MKFLGNIKSIFKDVVNEHRYSFGAFMLSMILWAITAGDDPAGDVLYSIFDFLKTIEWLLFLFLLDYCYASPFIYTRRILILLMIPNLKKYWA